MIEAKHIHKLFITTILIQHFSAEHTPKPKLSKIQVLFSTAPQVTK